MFCHDRAVLCTPHAKDAKYFSGNFLFSFEFFTLGSSRQRSVDPKEAKSSIGGVYNALVTSFTASTIQTAGQLTLGLHMGSLLKVICSSPPFEKLKRCNVTGGKCTTRDTSQQVSYEAVMYEFHAFGGFGLRDRIKLGRHILGRKHGG